MVEPAPPSDEGSEPPTAEPVSNDAAGSSDTKPGSGTGSSENPPPPPPSDRSVAGISAEGTLLTVRVSSVRVTGMGKWRVTKRVTLLVPAGLLVERANGESIPLVQLEPGDRLTITASAELSLEAQLGLPGALEATQILLRG